MERNNIRRYLAGSLSHETLDSERRRHTGERENGSSSPVVVRIDDEVRALIGEGKIEAGGRSCGPNWPGGNVEDAGVRLIDTDIPELPVDDSDRYKQCNEEGRFDHGRRESVGSRWVDDGGSGKTAVLAGARL